MEGVVDGTAIVAGRPALLAGWGLDVPDRLDQARRAAEAEGKTAVVAAWDGKARAVFVVGDQVKPTSADAVRRLRRSG